MLASTSTTDTNTNTSNKNNNNSIVDSWLATSAEWLDPEELQQAQYTTSHKTQTVVTKAITTTATTTTPSPGSSASLVERRRRRLHSKSTVDDVEMTSNTSGLVSTSAIERRDILTAVGPSKKRTAVPVRFQLAQLQFASPPLRLSLQDSELELPPGVSAMKKALVQAVLRNIIPQGLEDRLREQDVDLFEASMHLLEPSSVIRDSSYLISLWQTVESIYNDAKRAWTQGKDESVWLDIARSVLKASHSPNLELYNVQTQSIKPSLVPRHTTLSFDKKTNLALFFSEKYDTITRVGQRYPGLALSHMTDAFTSRLPVACGMEVKSASGDANTAVLQLGIWCAAALELLQTLSPEGGEGGGRTLHPMVGWTVIGHDWKLYITWKADDGRVTLFPPSELLTGTTISHLGILRLIALVKAVLTWQENEYWPWLREDILDKIQ